MKVTLVIPLMLRAASSLSESWRLPEKLNIRLEREGDKEAIEQIGQHDAHHESRYGDCITHS